MGEQSSLCERYASTCHAGVATSCRPAGTPATQLRLQPRPRRARPSVPRCEPRCVPRTRGEDPRPKRPARTAGGAARPSRGSLLDPSRRTGVHSIRSPTACAGAARAAAYEPTRTDMHGRDHSRMTLKAKELRYAVALTTAGELADESGVVLEVPSAWSPEHVLLASLVRCSLKSLRHHAQRQSID